MPSYFDDLIRIGVLGLTMDRHNTALISLAQRAAADASLHERSEALQQAVLVLNALPFKGAKVSDDQALAWPREGVFSGDGRPIIGIPKAVQEATSMLAGFILARIPLNDEALSLVYRKLQSLLIEEYREFLLGDLTRH